MNAKVLARGEVALSDTALHRVLRRIAPFVEWRAQPPLATHDRLMEESENRLTTAAHSGISTEGLVATRILDSPQDFRRWEDEHALLMRRVASEHRSSAQKTALLSASLALIHRKALFEYLRAQKVRGVERKHLLAHFHPASDYAPSMIAEHGNYLRSAASYMCSRHVGNRLMHDPVFGGPLLRYERLYARYFTAFCDSALARSGDQAGSYSRGLLLQLKHEVSDLRTTLIALARSH